MRVGRLAAVLVVTALAGGVAYVTALEPTAPPTVTPAVPHTTVTTPVPATASSPTTTARRETPSITAMESTDASPQGTVQNGLAAWGRFAVSGDLETVAPWFSPDGPQWAQFQTEAAELGDGAAAERPYTVLVEDAVVSREAGEAEVEARVTFVRTGEASQSFRWRILLRHQDDRWTIWTVDEAHSPSSISNP